MRIHTAGGIYWMVVGGFEAELEMHDGRRTFPGVPCIGKSLVLSMRTHLFKNQAVA